MKKVLISLLAISFFAVSCNNNDKVNTSMQATDDVADSLAISVGQLLAIDCYLSELSNYSDQIDRAVDDVYAGQINKLYEAYEYVNASDMLSKSYAKINADMNPELIKKIAKQTLQKAKDSLSYEQLHSLERTANEYIVTFFDKQFIKETARFLSDVEKKDGVQKTENGILYKIIKPGNGTISSTDLVDVNYTLYDYNGKVLDSNESTGKPFKVQLPSGVVPGFAQSIQLVGVGGKVMVWIPAELGYGLQGMAPKVQPGQALVFTIEVLKKY